MLSRTVDVVIPNFNGAHLLAKHLPKVIKLTPNLGKLIIVDDASTDNSVAYLRQIFPQATLVISKKNQGYTKSIILGAAHSTADFLVLINNDVEPLKGYLDHAFDIFDTNQDVGAVTFAEDQNSWPNVSFKDGKVHFTQGRDSKVPRLIAWPSGGSCILRRSAYDRAGGYNPIYSPGYWEDIDLGWRMWKTGSKIVWTPNSKVLHQHESTFKNLNSNYVSDLKARNELIFNWLNLTDPKYKVSHLLFLFRYSILHPGYLRIIFSAIRQIVTNKTEYPPISDSIVFSSINQSLYASD